MKQMTMRQSSALKKTRVNTFLLLTFLVIGALSTSCTKRIHVISDDGDKVPVTISVDNLGGLSYAQTKAVVDVAQVCSSLSFCIYPCEGESFDKIQINQTRDDPQFGMVSQNLTVGVHKIVVVAHNGDKNPTMTNSESIAFSSNSIQQQYRNEDYRYLLLGG